MRASLVSTGLALAALVGCGPAAPPDSPPAQGNAQPAVAPATSSKSAVPPAEPGIAPLTAEGWGPLRIGMPLADVVTAAGPDSEPEAVGGPEPEVCDIFHPARAPEGLRVMIEDGRLSRISLSAPTMVRTDRGLGPGAAAAEVEAAYGDALRSSPHEYEEAPARYLTVWTVGGGDEPYFRSPEARGLRYEINDGGLVAAVFAGGPSIQYVEGCL